MLKAMHLTLKNLDHIAPKIGWTRAELNYFYETNTYYGEPGYVVMEYQHGDLAEVRYVGKDHFNKFYVFVGPELETDFTRVAHL